MASIQEKIEQAQIKALHKLYDNNIKLTGKSSLVFRYRLEKNEYGDVTDYQFIKDDKIEIRIKYPGDLPLNRFRKSEASDVVNNSSLYLIDILPIQVFSKFDDNLLKGDFIVDQLKDENGNKINVLLAISESLGSINISNITMIRFDAGLYSGEIPAKLQKKLDQIVNDI